MVQHDAYISSCPKRQRLVGLMVEQGDMVQQVDADLLELDVIEKGFDVNDANLQIAFSEGAPVRISDEHLHKAR